MKQGEKWINAFPRLREALVFGGVLFLAAVMPLSFMNDLQESTPLLLLTFLSRFGGNSLRISV